MSESPDMILLEAEDAMAKAVEHLRDEMRGVRTGRASTALVEYVKVNYYGSMTELKALAAISVPEPTQLLIKPFDASAVGAIREALEKSDLGLVPIVEAKQIRLNIPALSSDRRKQLAAHVKKVGEQQKVVIRNTRRDANKNADGLTKSATAPISEDEVKTLKDEIQELVKKYETQIEELVEAKSKEVLEI